MRGATSDSAHFTYTRTLRRMRVISDRVYVQNVGSSFVSTDAGKTMTMWGGSDSHDLWVDPDDAQHVLYANDGGGTVTFTALNSQHTFSSRDYPTGQFYHVATTKHVPYHVCGAQQDASTICVPSEVPGGRGRGGGGGGRGNPTQETYTAGGAEPGYIAPDPADPDVFFAGGNNGSFMTRLNRRTGELREVGAYPREFSGEASSEVKERWQWTYPIIFSPVDPDRRSFLYLLTARMEDLQMGGRVGTRSARILRATIQRPWGHQAGRLRTT